MYLENMIHLLKKLFLLMRNLLEFYLIYLLAMENNTSLNPILLHHHQLIQNCIYSAARFGCERVGVL